MRKALGLITLSMAFGLPGSALGADLVNHSLPAGTESIISDRYPDSSQLDQEVADDFVVPAGQLWNIDGLRVFGEFTLVDNNPGADPPPPPDPNLFVRVYANEGNQPGQLLFTTGEPVAATGGPDYTIELTNGPTLNPGTYWISVQQDDAARSVNADFQFTQEWEWSLRTSTEGSPALVAGDIEGPCPQWSPLTCENGQGFAFGSTRAASTRATAGTSPRIIIVGTTPTPPAATTTATPTPPDVKPQGTCKGRTTTIYGTPGNDTITGTPGADIIQGGKGKDVVQGMGGDDLLCGGDGNDKVGGGTESDIVFGGANADVVTGGPGKDLLFGGSFEEPGNGSKDVCVGSGDKQRNCS